MAVTLEQQLLSFLDDATRASLKSAADREIVSRAGAKALAVEYGKAATAKHYSSRTEGDPHMADLVKYQNGDIDGIRDGSATVGFGDKGHIARFLNDGTVYRPGDHFIDTARREAIPAVVAAETKAYKRLLKRRSKGVK